MRSGIPLWARVAAVAGRRESEAYWLARDAYNVGYRTIWPLQAFYLLSEGKHRVARRFWSATQRLAYRLGRP